MAAKLSAVKPIDTVITCRGIGIHTYRQQLEREGQRESVCAHERGKEREPEERGERNIVGR